MFSGKINLYRMRSLQSRLGAGLLLSLIVAFSGLWLLVSFNIQFLAEDYIASRLKHDSETLLNSISFDETGKLRVDAERIDLIYNQPFSGHYFIINTGEESVFSRSLWDQRIKQAVVGTGEQKRLLQEGPEEQSLLSISAGYKKQGQLLTLTIAEDLNSINKNISRFKYGFAAMAAGMLFSLLILQIFILRKSLTSLTKIQHELKLLQQGEQDKLSKNHPHELHPLIDEVNHLLKTMQQQLRRSRDSLGDLAHAIKKPLTVIKQLTEKSDIPDSSNKVLIKQADDIYNITERILKRARLAGHGHGGTQFSFTKDLPELIDTLNMMYAEKSPQLIIQLEDNIYCPLDREDMLELLGNLLDNAYKWSESVVAVNVSRTTELVISIEDDGVGSVEEKMHELSKRGVRLDESVQGHGIGLAISADIVKDYNGKIQFSHSSKYGGFKVEIHLPYSQLI
ncbi:MAG TPA: HAMP domain-containing histidine kinase [Gammaproteobacteria bacterium]|nr:HAMP domain-containing histidine kinase [Gammaproteobacteria bacterium]